MSLFSYPSFIILKRLCSSFEAAQVRAKKIGNSGTVISPAREFKQLGTRIPLADFPRALVRFLSYNLKGQKVDARAAEGVGELCSGRLRSA